MFGKRKYSGASPALREKTPKQKIIYTMAVLVVLRIIGGLPTPGVDSEVVASLSSTSGSAFSFFDALTGGSLGSLSLGTLLVTPYITSSIVIQLLTVAIPKLEELSKDGKDGRDKIERATYILAGVLAVVEAVCMAVGFGRQGVFFNYTWYWVALATVCWGGFALLSVFAGKRIEKKGVGNGISLILMTNIVSSLPGDAVTLYERFCEGNAVWLQAVGIAVIVIAVLLVFWYTYELNSGEKHIPVVYSRKMAGSYNGGGTASSIPVKILVSGVLPVIFASSLVSFPGIILAVIGADPGGVPGFILDCLDTGNWFSISDMRYSVGYILYVVLVIFFGSFYKSISFNTYEIAENLRKSGGTIPGIRPGKPTVEYLDRQIKYANIIGTVGLLILATVPFMVAGFGNVSSLSFGGTSILIVVSVIFETRKDVQTLFAAGNVGKKTHGIFGTAL